MEECHCEEFLAGLEGPCALHNAASTLLRDRPAPITLSRAYSSIPDGLILAELPDIEERGIFANGEIAARTVYGPLVGILANAREPGSTARYAVGSREEGFLDYWLDCDDASNWMKFIRMDDDPNIYNLIAYQQNREIYFATTRIINPGEELKVWYSKSYYEEMNSPKLSLLEIPALKKAYFKQDPPPRAIVTNPSAISPLISKKKKTTPKLADELPTSSKGYIFKCNECEAAFRTESVLQLHKCRHGAPYPESINGMFSCPGCRLTLTSKADLTKHIDRHSKKQTASQPTVPCTKCDRLFLSEASMTLHYRQMHSDIVKEVRECEVCHMKLKSVAAYVSHMKKHTGSKTYFRCAVCLEHFRMSVQLQEHSLSHCINDRYPCCICEKSFDNFTTLTYHLKSVHATRKFVCETCGYAFADKHRLGRHMTTHSSEFNFKCELCDELFKDSEKLTRHKRRVHNPTRPSSTKRKVRFFEGSSKPRSSEDYMSFVYKCLDCRLGFYQKKLLMRHLEDRHPDKDLTLIPELNLPVVEVEMYPCTKCWRKYTSEEGLASHRERDHPGEEESEEQEEDDSEDEHVRVKIPREKREELRRKRETSLFYLCTVCDQRFWSAGKLLKHSESRHPGVDLMSLVN